MSEQYALGPGLVDLAFPFHLVLDRDLRLLRAGSSLCRLHGGDPAGLALDDLFSLEAPQVAVTFEALCDSRSLFLLRSRSAPALLLRGEILHTPGEDHLFFVGSPWVTETALFGDLGLALDDFAVSDGVVDYVLLLQNQATSLDESRDLVERLHRTAAQLTHQAYHDTLTDLPNRALLLQHLALTLKAGSDPRPRPFAVLMLDLDGFKAVNDSYGHPAGDDVLEEVGRRLRSLTRGGDLLARFGGDEFAIVLEPGLPGGDVSEVAVESVAQRVLERLREPIVLPAHPEISVELSASIGIAYRRGCETEDELLRNADLAMYAAKTLGKSRWVRYDAAMHVSSVLRLDLAQQLRRAIDGRELRLHFQPILCLADDRFAGAEALVRWAHPTRGLLGPDEFVDLAEETGLIVPIGAWVLDEACRELRRWQDDYTGAGALGVAVNISGRQLTPDLIATVSAALAAHRLYAGDLTLEITEGLIGDDGRAAQETLTGLKALGVRLSIDDFGTGHSSLGRLRAYDFDELKIDRSFVSDLDTGDPTYVTTQIDLARGLGLGVVAEGIETRAQLDYLRGAGCSMAQGYLLARPVTARAVRPLLAGSAYWAGAAQRV